MSLHIFDVREISEKIFEKNELDLEFKNEIEEWINYILKLNQTSSSEIFFNIKHINQTIKNSNKSSSPGPDCQTVEIVRNWGEQLFHCPSYLTQESYFLEYFPKPWKKENIFYLKNQDKESYDLENLCHSISFSNILWKIYERITVQPATNILEENNFFKAKNLYAYQ